MNHDDSAKHFIKQSGEQIGEAYPRDNAQLSLLASIAHSLCALNEKMQRVMDDECGLIEPTVTDYTMSGDNGRLEISTVILTDKYGKRHEAAWQINQPAGTVTAPTD